MKKIIHIHAKCNAFEFFEQHEEAKAQKRLMQIRKSFLWCLNKARGNDKLVVNTVLVNQELF